MVLKCDHLPLNRYVVKDLTVDYIVRECAFWVSYAQWELESLRMYRNGGDNLHETFRYARALDYYIEAQRLIGRVGK
jgi:hypothetical protein